MSDTKDRLYETNAEICKALSHPKRLEILDVLRKGEFAVEEIAKRTQMQKANLSQHLGVLRKVNLVSTRRDGLNIYYRIKNAKILEACDILKSVLADSLAQTLELASVLENEE